MSTPPALELTKIKPIAVEARRWTAEEIDKLHKMRALGMTYKQIGEVLGRTEHSVSHGLSVVAEAELRTWRQWTDDDMQKLCELRNAGVSVEECAKILDRTRNAVVTRISDIKKGRRYHKGESASPRKPAEKAKPAVIQGWGPILNWK